MLLIEAIIVINEKKLQLEAFMLRWRCCEEGKRRECTQIVPQIVFYDWLIVCMQQQLQPRLSVDTPGPVPS